MITILPREPLDPEVDYAFTVTASDPDLRQIALTTHVPPEHLLLSQPLPADPTLPQGTLKTEVTIAAGVGSYRVVHVKSTGSNFGLEQRFLAPPTLITDRPEGGTGPALCIALTKPNA